MTHGQQPKIWVVIADGEHARVVVPTAKQHHFTTHLIYDSVDAHKQSSDLGGERAGRHAVPSRSDPHLLSKHRFVVDVAEQINKHDNDHAFDQLVLVAPAHALHDLRAALSKTATAKVVGSETHDLVKIPDHDLPSHLAKWWLAPP